MALELSGIKYNHKHAKRIYQILNLEDAQPEVKLMACVLLRAILDICHKRTESCMDRRRKYDCGTCPNCSAREQARWWFVRSNGYFASYPSVCLVLNIDPKIIRNMLKKGGLL